jgi:hypothetical protein
MNPPITLPIKAPTTGIGISIWPVIAPRIDEPTVVVVFSMNPPNYLSFFLSVENLFENIL